MLRKITLSCAVAGALLFPIPTAFADDHNNNHNHDNNNQKHNDHDDHDHHHGDHHDHGHDGHGHRHYYHGRWWDYGVGPCWTRTPIGWVWFCD